MKQKKGLMLKLVTAVIALVLVLNLNPIPVQAIYVSEIVVEPEVAANQVGTVHTVTAVATTGVGGVVPGVEVYFSVIRGPNNGVNGVSITDGNGEASFTYTSNDFPGIDTISVDSDPSAGYKKFAKKVWLEEPTSDQIETDVFLQSAAEISFEDPLTGDCMRNWLTGITVVEVDLGSLGDSDGDGLEEVSAKIIMMELADPSDYLVLTGEGNSVGKIEELTNNNPGVLDIPPFAAGGKAVSTFGFDFSLLVQGALHFGNIEPVSLAAVIDHKPPEAVTWYNEANPVIHVGGEEIPEPRNFWWHWFILGEFSSYPEVQLELLPESATNPTGTDHTVTAVYTLDGFPLAGKQIVIIVSGPNAGVRYDGFTDAEGKATLTYTGDGGEGTDIIYAGSMLTIGYQDIHAIKVWEIAPNQAPLAFDDAYETDEDTPLNVAAPGVLGNDSDADGDPLAAVLDTGSSNGALALNADGSFSYESNPGFNGVDSFTYVANDGTNNSNVATVTITVNPVNDAPVASDDSDTTDEDTPVTIDVLANDSDVDGDSLAVSSVTPPTHGAAVINLDETVTYTPDQDYNGPDSFGYTAVDGNGGTDTATVTITVNPVNDAPVASDDSATTDEDTPVTIDVLANDSDADGNPLTAVLNTGSSNGALTLNADGSFSYIPNPNFNGVDSFTYAANDGQANSNMATVTITVINVNYPPVAHIKDIDDEMIPLPVTIKVTPQTLNLGRLGNWVKIHIHDDTDNTPQQMEVTLDGSSSFDPDGDPLIFDWTLIGPNGDVPVTDGVATQTVMLSAGSYHVILGVNDGKLDSVSATLNFTLINETIADLTASDPGDLTLNNVPASEIKGGDASIVVSFDDDAIAATVSVGLDVEMRLEGSASGVDYIDVIQDKNGGSGKGKSNLK